MYLCVYLCICWFVCEFAPVSVFGRLIWASHCVCVCAPEIDYPHAYFLRTV